MLPNLPANFEYELLPRFIISLDARRLIQAVVGGYQYRIADTRSYVGYLPELIDPTAAPMAAVQVAYLGEVGNVVTATLDTQADTPTDPALLPAWAATQLNIDPRRVTAAVLGTDALRTVGVNTLALLAATVGATLYPPALPTDPAELLRRQQQMVLSLFPRLKIRGTAQSWSVLARLVGFDGGTMVPLWGRLSPRIAGDVGDPANDPDFSAEPEFFPAPALPDPTLDYDPQVFNDGPYYLWQSGTLVTSPTAANTYLSVNGYNPFISLSLTGTAALDPDAGTYCLQGGNPGQVASAALDGGTTVSNLTASALVPGSTLNGLQVVVEPLGLGRQLSILAPLTSLKYRTSYFDATVFTTTAGTVAVGPNLDLAADPALTSDGTAVVPFFPWAGSLPRRAASPGTPMVDQAGLQAAGAVAFSFLDEVRVATRQPRRLGVGLGSTDRVPYAPFPAEALLAPGPGTFSKSLASTGSVPAAAYTAQFFAWGTVALSTQVTSGTAYIFGGAGISGTWNTATSSGTVTSTGAPVWGSWAQVDTETITAAPFAGTVIATLLRPETGTATLPYLVGTFDDARWRRPLLARGAAIDLVSFEAFGSDQPPNPVELTLRVLDEAGVPRPLRILDRFATSGSTPPPRVRVLPPDTDDTIGLPALAGPAGPFLTAGGFVIGQGLWSHARRHDRVAWWPLTEHRRATPIEVREVVPYPNPVVTGVAQNNRIYDPAWGWGLKLGANGRVESQENRGWGGAGALSLVVSAAAPLLNYRPVATLGPLNLTASSGTYTAACGPASSSLAVPASPHLVYAGVDGNGTLALAAGPMYGSLALSYSFSASPLIGTTLAIFGAPELAWLQDLNAWTVPRTTLELASMLAPVSSGTVPPLGSGYTLAPADSTRGDAYGFTELTSGQVVPLARPTSSEWRPAFLPHYLGDAEYAGDDRFKQVGLGNAVQFPGQVRLGTQGPELWAHGQMVVAGTNSILPGYATWTSGVIPPAPNTNGAVDRIYLHGSDTGAAYEVTLQDPGSGVSFAASPVPRARQGAPGIQEYPTDALGPYTSLGLSNVKLAVVGGTVTTVPYSGTVFSPNLYIYLRERTSLNAPSALTRWSNPSAFGLSQVPPAAALTDNGVLNFLNPETLAAGFYQLNLTAGNLGTVDSDFSGFSVTVTLAGASGAPVVTAANLLPDAAGTNPQGTTAVPIYLPATLVGPWQLSVAWSNAAAVPSRGQMRQLAVYGYSFQALVNELYNVLVDPFGNPPTLVRVPIINTPANVGTPGAGVARLNSFGSVAAYAHESTIFPQTLGTDTYNNPPRPLADLATGSSWGRVERFWVNNAVTSGDLAPLPLPSWHSLTLNPAVGPYNLGEVVTLAGSVTGGTPPLRYVWNFGSLAGTTASGYSPSIPWTLNAGGSTTVQATVVDDHGNSAKTSLSWYVNQPPVILGLTTRHNNLPAPYTTSLKCQAIDPEGSPLTTKWFIAGSLVATGTSIPAYQVNQAVSVAVAVSDPQGGTTQQALPLFALSPTPPTVAITSWPALAKAGFSGTQALSLSGLVTDTANLGLASVSWGLWNGASLAGTVVPVPGFSGLYAVTAQAAAHAVPAGPAEFDLTAVDLAGRTTTAGASFAFVAPSAPLIESLTLSNLAVTSGGTLYGSVRAISAAQLPLSYNWTFTVSGSSAFSGTTALSLGGPDVAFGVSPWKLQQGDTISAFAVVADSTGDSTAKAAPLVTVFNTVLPPVGFSVPSGNYTAAIAVALTAAAGTPAAATIIYTLDGSDPAASATAQVYGGPIGLGPGVGTVVLSARVLNTGQGISPLATVSYVFSAPAA